MRYGTRFQHLQQRSKNFNMDTNKITTILEGFELKPEQIDEIMIQFEDLKDSPEKQWDFNDTTENLLKSQLVNEVDWRKRAAIAAAIISHNLDH